MKDKIFELYTVLEDVITDDQDRYLVTIKNDKGEFTQIIGRKEYLELVLESTLNDLGNLLEELGGVE